MALDTRFPAGMTICYRYFIHCVSPKKGDCYDNAAMEAGATALKSGPFMMNGFKLDQMPSNKCSNSLKCISIAKGFTPSRAISAQKLLKLKKSFIGMSVKAG